MFWNRLMNAIPVIRQQRATQHALLVLARVAAEHPDLARKAGMR